MEIVCLGEPDHIHCNRCLWLMEQGMPAETVDSITKADLAAARFTIDALRADADALRVIISHKDAAIAELRDRVAKKDRLLDEARTQLRSRRVDVRRLAKTLRGVADELTDNKEI